MPPTLRFLKAHPLDKIIPPFRRLPYLPPRIYDISPLVPYDRIVILLDMPEFLIRRQYSESASPREPERRDKGIQTEKLNFNRPIRLNFSLVLFLGAASGTRTHDLFVTNEMLYQLSYCGFSTCKITYIFLTLQHL